jgi:FkbM family methyltransferase
LKKEAGSLFYHKVYVKLYKLKSKVNPLVRYLKERKRIEMRKHFYATFINENDLCFDVGANYGNRVKAFVDLKAKVVAIEPQKKCCEFLERKFGKKITVINKGLGAKPEIKNFYEADLSALSTFSEEWIKSVKETRFKQHTWQKAQKIEIITLDKLIEQFGAPSFIKIDVEGYEAEVLSGLHIAVRMISFEYTVPEKIAKITECIKKIESLDQNIECNFSVKESMQFSLPDWVGVRKMIEIVKTDEFTATSAGDIYVRLCDKAAPTIQKSKKGIGCNIYFFVC